MQLRNGSIEVTNL